MVSLRSFMHTPFFNKKIFGDPAHPKTRSCTNQELSRSSTPAAGC